MYSSGSAGQTPREPRVPRKRESRRNQKHGATGLAEAEGRKREETENVFHRLNRAQHGPSFLVNSTNARFGGLIPRSMCGTLHQRSVGQIQILKMFRCRYIEQRHPANFSRFREEAFEIFNFSDSPPLKIQNDADPSSASAYI